MRAANHADIESLHQLIRAIETGDSVPLATSLVEVRDYFEDPDVDVTSDIVVIDGDGPKAGLIGWGMVEHHPSGTRLERAHLHGGIHPDHRGAGFGRTILAWSLARAATQMADTPAELPAYGLLHAREEQVETLRLASRLGFEVIRYDDELLRSLDDLPEIVPIDGITIRPWHADDAEGTRLAYNASFADHWGSTPRSPESWGALLAAADVRIDLSFVATDDTTGEIVAYSLNDFFPEDEMVTGRRDGWIGSLGTLRSHRKRGLASALIVASLHRFVEAGMTAAMLGVDTDNPTGAYGLYEGLGFAPLNRSITLQTTIRTGTTEG